MALDYPIRDRGLFKGEFCWISGALNCRIFSAKLHFVLARFSLGN